VTAADGRTVGAILFIDQFPTEVASFVRAVLPFILGSALVLTVGAALIGTLFGFFTARRLTARFQNLTGAALAWSLGDFTTGIEDRSHDEIGQLARALNRMSEQLENLLETRKELTRLETRNRLARELHDSVKQQVFATAMQIGAAQALIEQDSRQTKEHLANARQLVTQAQQELKTLIHEMRPAALEGKGLAPALGQYADGWSRRHDIAVEMHVRGQRQTPLPIEQALFRVVQEALANVARHSHADVVHITLVWDGAQCTLRLRDHGAGFLVDQVAGGGFGLQSMRQRLAALNGSLHVASEPGAGTTVTATVPLNA
jgi:NarL family two-component system sensor histidine kinase LiaS